MPSRRERLAEFVATGNPAKAIRPASLSLARAPVALSDLWAAIERTGDLLSVVISKLEAAQDVQADALEEALLALRPHLMNRFGGFDLSK